MGPSAKDCQRSVESTCFPKAQLFVWHLGGTSPAGAVEEKVLGVLTRRNKLLNPVVGAPIMGPKTPRHRP